MGGGPEKWSKIPVFTIFKELIFGHFSSNFVAAPAKPDQILSDSTDVSPLVGEIFAQFLLRFYRNLV